MDVREELLKYRSEIMAKTEGVLRRELGKRGVPFGVVFDTDRLYKNITETENGYREDFILDGNLLFRAEIRFSGGRVEHLIYGEANLN